MLQVLYSLSHQPLTKAVLEEIANKQRSWPQERCILLVPERVKLTYERALLDYLRETQGEKNGASALLLSDVLSFSRLSGRILDAGGHKRGTPMSQVSQTLRVAKLLNDHQNNLRCFGRLAGKIGFVGQIVRLIGDARRYQVTSVQLKQAMNSMAQRDGVSQSFFDRIHDLSVILEAYEADIGKDAIEDTSQVIQLASIYLARAMLNPHHEWINHTHFYVAGFGDQRDFTPQEYALLEGLERHGASVTITVVADQGPEGILVSEDGATAFEPGRQTLKTIQQFFPTAAYSEIPITLSEEKKRIAETWFHDLKLANVSNASNSDEAFHIAYATSVEVEADLCAASIQSLVQDGRFRYRDICVLPLEVQKTIPALKTAFKKYGIPLYVDTPHLMAASSLRIFLLSLINLARFGWEPEIVWNLLRTGFFDADDQTIDILENAVLARGIDRRNFWDDRKWVDEYDVSRLGASLVSVSAQNDAQVTVSSVEKVNEAEANERDDQGQEVDADVDVVTDDTYEDEAITLNQMHRVEQAHNVTLLARLKDDRDRLLGRLKDKVRALSQTSDLGERARILMECLQVLDVEHSIQAQNRNDDTESAIFRTQAWNLTIELLATYAKEGHGIECQLADCYAYFDLGITMSLASTIPSRVDQVTVASETSMLAFDGPILFVLGASRDRLPGTMPTAGLLSEQEKLLLNEILDHGFSVQTAGGAGAKNHALWHVLTAFDQVWLSHHGKEAEASQVLSHIAQQETCCTPIHANMDWADGVRPQIDRENGQPIELHDPNHFNLNKRLAEGLILSMMPVSQVMSVSRFEMFMSCAYRHLNKALLKVTERQVFAPELNQMGILIHAVYERYFMDLKAQLQSTDVSQREAIINHAIKSLEQGQLTDIIHDYMRAVVVKDPALHVYHETPYRASSAKRAEVILKQTIIASLRELGAKAHYIPIEQEWAFGMGDTPALVVDDEEGQSIQFRGVIDRIDMALDSVNTPYFRVIDYKTGSRAVDFNRLWHGLDIQLPIYLKAVQQLYKGASSWIPADAEYHLIKSSRTLMQYQREADLEDVESWVETNRKGEVKKEIESNNLNFNDESLVQATIDHVMHQTSQGIRRLFNGDCSAQPIAIEGTPSERLPCSYCAYRGICRVEVPQAVYHRKPKLKDLLLDLPLTEQSSNTQRSHFAELLKHIGSGKNSSDGVEVDK